MSKKVTVAEARKRARQAIAWMKTPEGAERIRRAAEEAVRGTERLGRDRRVSRRKLYENYGPGPSSRWPRYGYRAAA